MIAEAEQPARILIYQAIDDLDRPAAKALAMRTDELTYDYPQTVIDTIDQAQKILENPKLQLDKLRLPKSEPELEKSESERRFEIALAIATLLAHTHHGKFVAFDETTYDLLSKDPAHRRLLANAGSSDRRSRGNVDMNRRRVVLSGLKMVASRHLLSQESAQANKTREAAIATAEQSVEDVA